MDVRELDDFKSLEFRGQGGQERVSEMKSGIRRSRGDADSPSGEAHGRGAHGEGRGKSSPQKISSGRGFGRGSGCFFPEEDTAEEGSQAQDVAREQEKEKHDQGRKEGRLGLEEPGRHVRPGEIFEEGDVDGVDLGYGEKQKHAGHAQEERNFPGGEEVGAGVESGDKGPGKKEEHALLLDKMRKPSPTGPRPLCQRREKWTCSENMTNRNLFRYFL